MLDMTNMILLFGVFAFVFMFAFGALYWFAPRDMRNRIEQAGGPRVEPRFGQDSAAQDGSWFERIVEISKPISRLSVPKEGWELSALRVRLVMAGWRGTGAIAVYFAAKTILAFLLPLLASFWIFGSPLTQNTFQLAGVLILLCGLGYYLPNYFVGRCITARQRQIFEAFPDAIDLMTVCVEAGLGLDAALMKVADEVRLRSPVVADELELLILEIRSGFAKEKALRNFSLRTGVEDIDSFTTMLIQAERFGTSIGTSLRVLSDTLRTRRRMRAEEMAAKIGLKLLFPLLFCIFPALMVVLMGPAFIHIYRILLPGLGGH
ncbi:type II secretion system F family protein [Paraburkholderia pallida]